MSPSGKAPDFDSGIRRFKSGHPSQKSESLALGFFICVRRTQHHLLGCAEQHHLRALPATSLSAVRTQHHLRATPATSLSAVRTQHQLLGCAEQHHLRATPATSLSAVRTQHHWAKPTSFVSAGHNFIFRRADTNERCCTSCK